MKTQTPEDIKEEKKILKFTLENENKKDYNLILTYGKDYLTILIENLKIFPISFYELNTTLDNLKKKDENFLIFQSIERLVNGIELCIKNKNYSIKYDEIENLMKFSIKNDFFINNEAILKIPLKEQDLKVQMNSLIKAVMNLQKENKELKEKIELFERKKGKDKKEIAKNSFIGSSFLEEENKIFISEWIDPNKIISFTLLFSTTKDGDSSSTFHYYCDGLFPTVTVILDTSGRKFGGYTSQNWGASKVGDNYSRDQNAFLFNLGNKKKCKLIDKFDIKAIYKGTEYGPLFGNGHDLYLANGCTGNSNSYCNKKNYDTGDTNLLGIGGSTNFQVKFYEVYHVIFE